ncbi:hypothetical protein JTE90_028834 [Oedothorax gibbosus]|uniref:Uncharacterized protein n=1 Tax=Oedothorax gibbosus TaxID=931172 RepID=A0AAV6VWM9_9ARAC|nr:hypothetical protein JTE90_028834 [Oedothorax gibbosus]
MSSILHIYSISLFPLLHRKGSLRWRRDSVTHTDLARLCRRLGNPPSRACAAFEKESVRRKNPSALEVPDPNCIPMSCRYSDALIAV